MDESRQRIARLLFELGAIKDKRRSPRGMGFRLARHRRDPEAVLSPVYVHLRTPDHPTTPGPLTPYAVRLLGSELAALVRNQELAFDSVAGVPHAGDPLARAFAEAWHGGCSRISLSKIMEDGEQRISRPIARLPATGEVVLVIDDVITDADTKREAIQALEGAGAVVSDVLVVVDREQGGARELQSAGYRVHSLFTLRDLLGFYRSSGCMDEGTYGEIIRYLQASD